jgi:hypothetical protein
MSALRDQTVREAAEVELKICERCGWTDMPASGSVMAHDCNPIGGDVAEAIAAKLPGVPATLFGYGDDVIAFPIDDNLDIRFRINRFGSIRFDELFCLDDFDVDKVAALVTAIKGVLRKG